MSPYSYFFIFFYFKKSVEEREYEQNVLPSLSPSPSPSPSPSLSPSPSPPSGIADIIVDPIQLADRLLSPLPVINNPWFGGVLTLYLIDMHNYNLIWTQKYIPAQGEHAFLWKFPKVGILKGNREGRGIGKMKKPPVGIPYRMKILFELRKNNEEVIMLNTNEFKYFFFFF
jgi:hypothetical protein